MATLRYNRWTKHDKDRLYIERATGFKNRPWEQIGYIDLSTNNLVPGHAQHQGSVEAILRQAGTTVSEIIEQQVK